MYRLDISRNLIIRYGVSVTPPPLHKTKEMISATKRLLNDVDSIEMLYQRLGLDDVREHITSIPFNISVTDVTTERYLINQLQVNGNELDRAILKLVESPDAGRTQAIVQQVIVACSRVACRKDVDQIMSNIFSTDNFVLRRRNITPLPIEIETTIESVIVVRCRSLFEILSKENQTKVLTIEMELINSIKLPQLDTSSLETIQEDAAESIIMSEHFLQIRTMTLSSIPAIIQDDPMEKLILNQEIQYETQDIDAIQLLLTRGIFHIDWKFKTTFDSLIQPGDILIKINQQIVLDKSNDEIESLLTPGSLLVFASANKITEFTWTAAGDEELFQCTLDKGTHGLGLNFTTAVSQGTCYILVDAANPFVEFQDGLKGPAELSGEIKGGEVLESISGVDVVGKNIHQIAAIYQSIESDTVVLGLRRNPKGFVRDTPAVRKAVDNLLQSLRMEKDDPPALNLFMNRIAKQLSRAESTEEEPATPNVMTTLSRLLSSRSDSDTTTVDENQGPQAALNKASAMFTRMISRTSSHDSYEEYHNLSNVDEILETTPEFPDENETEVLEKRDKLKMGLLDRTKNFRADTETFFGKMTETIKEKTEGPGMFSNLMKKPEDADLMEASRVRMRRMSNEGSVLWNKLRPRQTSNPDIVVDTDTICETLDKMTETEILKIQMHCDARMQQLANSTISNVLENIVAEISYTCAA